MFQLTLSHMFILPSFCFLGRAWEACLSIRATVRGWEREQGAEPHFSPEKITKVLGVFGVWNLEPGVPCCFPSKVIDHLTKNEVSGDEF